jgi:hypothetical protein
MGEVATSRSPPRRCGRTDQKSLQAARAHPIAGVERESPLTLALAGPKPSTWAALALGRMGASALAVADHRFHVVRSPLREVGINGMQQSAEPGGPPGRGPTWLVDSRRESESAMGRDHRRWTLMDGVDDLGVVDPAQIHGGNPEIGMPNWRWMTSNGTPSRDIPTACACRS